MASYSGCIPSIEHVKAAELRMRSVVRQTALEHNVNLSEEFAANIYLKREDLQVVRSYKIRGAYNKISSLSPSELERGVVCASAGNHAQGVALSCHKLRVHGKIYMPVPTPQQKVRQVAMFGKEFAEIVLAGDTFDDAYKEAMQDCARHGKTFIHPFDDPKIIEGQATVGLEILDDAEIPIDYVFIPIGGGGLAAGVASVFKALSPSTKLIGIEPMGAPAMYESRKQGVNVMLEKIDKFVDGAAVKRVGDLTFAICQEYIDDIVLVPEGQICTRILRLYNEEAIVVEPAGALSIAGLEHYRENIRGKNVVCILSGSNNDITRTEEIKERSMLYEGLKHYFIVSFPQRAGALREFLSDVLGPTDDITYFQYSKKTSRERGPAVVGLELQHREDFHALIERMKARNIRYEYLNDRPELLRYIV
ncbi:MAG: threonine ammonia-lyase [Bacteroidota bacterium]|nr:threonine ammonia-lyase [Candidatus Kapabacteria bacterium]MDW8219465.1 threonine ammonia-lyase [Bacteroidota bacterium]